MKKFCVMFLRSKIAFIVFIWALINGCSGGGSTNSGGLVTVNPIHKEKVNGFVQKGPYINGSSIMISELNQFLSQTGKNFNAIIIDNTGTFEINNVDLDSQYVALKADGFYFNEVSGNISDAPLTLYAVCDITDKSSINVNILSHLEKSRVEYLISSGLTFTDAKKVAQADILKIFEIVKADISDSESLDISNDSADNAILLAVSVILQGYRTPAELTELLANISTDIRQNGVLDSQSYGSALINDARLLNLATIRANLENRYRDLGIVAAIPSFEQYVTHFVNNTRFVSTNSIDYPETSIYGENILFGSKSVFNSGRIYSMAATLPSGTSLKIVLRGGSWGYEAMPNGPLNWSVTQYNWAEKSQVMTAIESGRSSDLRIMFDPNQGSSPITIEYYENNASSPTRTKVISIIDAVQ